MTAEDGAPGEIGPTRSPELDRLLDPATAAPVYYLDRRRIG